MSIATILGLTITGLSLLAALGYYMNTQTDRYKANMKLRKRQRDANTIWQWLTDNPKASYTTLEIWRPSRGISANEFGLALHDLAELGIVKIEFEADGMTYANSRDVPSDKIDQCMGRVTLIKMKPWMKK